MEEEKKKDNRRVRYTKKVLREALIELLKTKPISRITVTDICTHADLNRGTFYNYYTDAYDLLSQIEEGLYKDLIRQIKRFEEDGVSGPLLAELMLSIEKNRELCHVLFNINSDRTFFNRLFELMKPHAFAYWEKNNVNKMTEAQMELLYSFFANGTVGVLCRWIAGELDVPSDYLAKTILALGVKGAEYFFKEQEQALPIIKFHSVQEN